MNRKYRSVDLPVVMIIDDEMSTRMIAREFLTQAGFDVEEACDGNEALGRLADLKPDLILLDVEMPGLNGFEVCQAIRKLPEFAMTPVLMLTGLNSNESIDLAYEAGATDFATKPINWSLLCHRLRYMQRSALAERKIHQLAYFDTLTGLANRTLFHDRLQRAIMHAQATDTMLGILYFDLDDFKRINDTFGHSTGDQILQEVGRRIVGVVNSNHAEGHSLNVTVARMGGDEFTLLLGDLSSEDQAKQYAENIIKLFSEPFELDGSSLFTSPSVGISFYPQDGVSVDTLLTNADMAMYEAKQTGKNGYKTHNVSRDAVIRRRHSLSDRMRGALKNESFSVFYQPQFDIHTGRAFAAEALLRWNDDKEGSISPAEFIPIAEDNGLIVPLGEWVLRKSCEQAKTWQRDGFSFQNVAVNISALQFMQAGFVDMVASALESSELSPDHLELEITESVLATDINNAVSTLEKLKELGVTLSIDDFGTGYSSLSQIKLFPIDRLKIDQSFIRNISQSSKDEAITRAVIAMANSMNLKVLAEGVETTEHIRFLKENNCDEIQGFLLSKPISAGELSASWSEINQRSSLHFAEFVGANWANAA